MIEHYGLADALAIHYQKMTKAALRVIFFVSGLSTIFLFELFGHGPEAIRQAALLGYLVIGLGTYFAYLIVKPAQFKTRHLDYRALAEGMRLQIFWKIAGLDEQVADYYLRKQKTELAWIRIGVRQWSFDVDAHRGDPEFTLVQAHWIEDQCKFFAKAAKRDLHKHHIRESRTYALAAVTALIAACVLWASWRWGTGLLKSKVGTGDWSMDLHEAIVIIMAMLPALAAAMAAYALKMAFGEQQKQYQRMGNLFMRGSECVKQALKEGDKALAIKTMIDLGKEAMEENGDWVLLHRDRAVEPPLGG